MEILRNAWYLAAWANEIERRNLFHRNICDISVLLFRDESGTVCALLDRCPHRFAPLHLGNLLGSTVECVYHGLQFDGRGKCSHNPHGDGHIPPGLKVQTFPVCEKNGGVWIWMGDASKANIDDIPEFDYLNPNTNYVSSRYLFVRVNYMLEIENLLDLSHLGFLHSGTLGSASIGRAEIEISQEGMSVFSSRLTRGETLPGYLEHVFGLQDGQVVDRWLDAHWDPPANITITAGVTATGKSRIEGKQFRSAHIFSPESDTCTHYFFAVGYAKEWGPWAEAAVEAATEGLLGPFVQEDVPMLEAQQREMNNAHDGMLRPVVLPVDVAAMRARRVLEQLVATERLDQ
jgi:phenylpropionate dioxygenase-like ring-hydroxylating dioxygenase large terminal subunit